MKKFIPAVLLTCALSGIAVSAQAQTLRAYLSAPAAQTSIFTLVTVETFEGYSTGKYTSLSSVIGTYTTSGNGKIAIQGNDQYGTGTGQYLAFGAQTGTSNPIALTFKAPQSYFGFSWNAGDRNNGIGFYNGTTLLAHYSTDLLVTLLQNPTVQSYDGSHTYNSRDYYGQPVTHKNSGEPYGFVNFIETGGTFDRVVFDNSGTPSTGFESDNHTILFTGGATAPSSFVLTGVADVSGGPGSGTFSTPSPFAIVPEPGVWTIFGSASLLLIGALIQGKRRASTTSAI